MGKHILGAMIACYAWFVVIEWKAFLSGAWEFLGASGESYFIAQLAGIVVIGAGWISIALLYRSRNFRVRVLDGIYEFLFFSVSLGVGAVVGLLIYWDFDYGRNGWLAFVGGLSSFVVLYYWVFRFFENKDGSVFGGYRPAPIPPPTTLNPLVPEHDPRPKPMAPFQGSPTTKPEPKLRKPISRAVKKFVWQRDSGRCTECGSKKNLEFDHIIPVSEDGSNTERNLQLLCQSCNRKKGASI